MKLFAVACLTGATAQSGDYDDRGAVGDSDYYNAYDNYDEFGNKKKNKGQDNWFGGGAKQYASTSPAGASDWASALNCWPANIEADTLVSPNHRMTGTTEANHFENGGTSRDPLTYPNQYDFNLAPQHVYGSFEVSNRANERALGLQATDTNANQEDPVQRSGLGGLYQFGHDTYADEDHNEHLDPQSTRGTQWFHYKQARHAGCLYEKSDWHYGHDTFDKVFVANYYQGYAAFDASSAEPAFNAASQDAQEVHPIWWHFFNAHVLPNNDGGANYPTSQTKPSETNYLNPQMQKSIPLVMANPAYEGLGYLNFVVEYKYLDAAVGEDYKEFIDSSAGGAATLAATYQTKSTYRKINDCSETDGQECSGHVEGVSNNSWNGVHGHYYYDLYMGSWSIMGSTDNGRDRTWSTYPFDTSDNSITGLFEDALQTVKDFDMDLYSTSGPVSWGATSDLVVSSFPHNNLGKDFRFNLRVLMRTHNAATARATVNLGGANTSPFHSYYFYKINEISIEFPFNVAYALYHENRDSATTTSGRITVADPSADEWWKTLNNDAHNHPGYNQGGDPAQYIKQLDASTIGGVIGNQNTLDQTTTTVEAQQFMHRSASNVNMNIIPPVDLGTHAPNGGGFHRIRGFINPATSFAAGTAPDWCLASATGGDDKALERLCGKNFYIKGLMNTYDERRGQRGTYQEIWVQLQYALGTNGRDSRTICSGNLDGRCTASHPVQSPWPYLHFMASEIVSIQADCNTNSVNNANTCKKQPTGPGQPNDSFYGGK